MAGNQNLNAAIKAKKDEFYTRMDDISNELKHYRKHFRDKVVFCNCDDPYESNFFKYFALNFNSLGLKKLIATCYDGSPVIGNELLLQFDTPESEPRKVAYKVEITEVDDYNGDGAVNLADVAYLLKNDKNVLSRLRGDTIYGEDGKMYGPGDFRSEECVDLLKQADIVCTNPPFSLFREYVAQLMKYEKQFLIIGNKNALHYKELFYYVKRNLLWVGMRPFAGGMWFEMSGEECKTIKKVDGILLGNVPSIWFTNLDIPKRHETVDLIRRYTPEEYPTYDNYPAINVNKTSDIPCDYEGVMGVPITFMDKYNPDQFEIVDTSTNAMPKGAPYVNGKRIYERILIRRKNTQLIK